MQQKKSIVPITRLLARNSTTRSLELLRKHGKHVDADNKEELHRNIEFELADLYRNHPDKIEIEKSFSEIHPHKDVILKHFSPKLELKETSVAEEVRSNFSGDTEKKSCTCGCSKNFSNADGASAVANISTDKLNSMILGIVAVVGAVAIVKILKMKHA